MRGSTRDMVARVDPLDEVETHHRADILGWIDSGEEIFRAAKPATPPKHLVSYCVLVDTNRRAVLLVDHRDAQLWLPTGGHVDPGEHPAAAARREIAEELAIHPEFHPRTGEDPVLVTVTETGGLSAGHTDVSLWFAFDGSMGQPVRPDAVEFVEARWWPFAEVVHGPETRFDPHLPRFLEKLETPARHA